MYKFVLLLSIIVSPVSASQLKDCNDSEQKFVRSIVTKINESRLYIPSELDENYKKICKMEELIVMDGLAYYLYQNIDSNEYVVGIYNGLDGNYRTYGPFVK